MRFFWLRSEYVCGLCCHSPAIVRWPERPVSQPASQPAHDAIDGEWWRSARRKAPYNEPVWPRLCEKGGRGAIRSPPSLFAQQRPNQGSMVLPAAKYEFNDIIFFNHAFLGDFLRCRRRGVGPRIRLSTPQKRCEKSLRWWWCVAGWRLRAADDEPDSWMVWPLATVKRLIGLLRFSWTGIGQIDEPYVVWVLTLRCRVDSVIEL